VTSKSKISFEREHTKVQRAKIKMTQTKSLIEERKAEKISEKSDTLLLKTQPSPQKSLIKELEDRIKGYQKAMVDFEKKSYERAKLEYDLKFQKAREELKKDVNNAGNLPMLEKVIKLSDIEKVLGK